MANLRKWFLAILTVATLVSASAPVLAFETKAAPVAIAATVSGDIVTLTAVTPKEGSAYSDSWAGATKVDTVLRADGYYVSTATFSAAGLGDGSYPISYHITMSAGTSDVTWTGEATTTIILQPSLGVPPRSGTSGLEI